MWAMVGLPLPVGTSGVGMSITAPRANVKGRDAFGALPGAEERSGSMSGPIVPERNAPPDGTRNAAAPENPARVEIDCPLLPPPTGDARRCVLGEEGDGSPPFLRDAPRRV